MIWRQNKSSRAGSSALAAAPPTDPHEPETRNGRPLESTMSFIHSRFPCGNPAPPKLNFVLPAACSRWDTIDSTRVQALCLPGFTPVTSHESPLTFLFNSPNLGIWD